MKETSSEEESHKLFRDIWRLLYTNPRMFHYYVKTAQLSIHERRLLKCLYHYKDNKKKTCLELLETSIPDDSFLEGMRYYIKGLVYNQHSHYFYAIENLEKAIEHFKFCGDNPMLLNCYYLLVVVHGNRREIPKIALILDELDKLPPQSGFQKIQHLYSRLIYFVLMNQKKVVMEICSQGLICRAQGPEYEGFHPYFLVQRFMLHAKNEDFAKCYEILAEYQQLSGNMVRANYVYMKTLLDHLTKDGPLYVYARDFNDFPELHQQLEVIKWLREGNIKNASKFWNKLAGHNQELYGTNFEFKGDHSLFAQALKRYVGNTAKTEFDLKELEAIPSLLDKLHFILSTSPGPVEMEELIKLLWKEEAFENSLARLRTLVSRYNRKFPNKIVALRGTYQIKTCQSA